MGVPIEEYEVLINRRQVRTLKEKEWIKQVGKMRQGIAW